MNMKALLLNGSLKKDFDVEQINSSIIEELERNGFKTESILLREIKVTVQVLNLNRREM